MNTINHECYVSLEVANLLKEAGFDWECGMCYSVDSSTIIDNSHCTCNWNCYENNYSAPTLEVAQRWLREVKDLIISMVYTLEGWKSVITFPKPMPEKIVQECVFCKDNYEQAQETGIKKALEIILEKGE